MLLSCSLWRTVNPLCMIDHLTKGFQPQTGEGYNITKRNSTPCTVQYNNMLQGPDMVHNIIYNIIYNYCHERVKIRILYIWWTFYDCLFHYDGQSSPIIHANPTSLFHSRSSNALIGDSENDKGHLIYISIAYRHNCYVYSCVYIASL